MALVKPIMSAISAFDANQEHTFYFTANGGDQVVANELQIFVTTISGGTQLKYDKKITSYSYSHTISAKTLSNDIAPFLYLARVRTFDSKNNASDWSEYETFVCISTPTLSFNITNNSTINSSNLNIILNYSQSNGELFNYGVIYLYDKNYNLIDTSGELYNTTKPPLNISYLFTGLINKESYSIIAKIVTKHGMVVYTDRLNFNIEYSSSILYSNLDLTPHNCEGYIDVSSRFVSLDGISNPPTPTYIADTIDLLDFNSNPLDDDSKWVKWDKGFEIPNEFILRIWVSVGELASQSKGYEKTIVLIKNNDKEIKIKPLRTKDGDYINLSNSNGTNILSEKLNYIKGNDKVFIWAKITKDSSEIKASVIYTETENLNWYVDTKLVWNMPTDISYVGETISNNVLIGDYNKIVAQNSTYDTLIIGNGIFDHINITSDIDLEYTTNIPVWTNKTIFDCNFNSNINGGNVNSVLSKISKLKLKRREINSVKWITILEKSITNINDININFKDYGIPSYKTQEYAIVPTLEDDIEGDYIVNTVTPKWNGVFISDGETSFKLYEGVNYDTTLQNKSIGSLIPIGRKYPVIIENADSNYKSGTITGQLYGYNFEKTRKIDRADIVKQTDDFTSFITNGSSKIFTDWNGNIFIFKLVSSPAISYNQSSGLAITTVGLSWVEQGKYDNQYDLIDNGLVPLRRVEKNNADEDMLMNMNLNYIDSTAQSILQLRNGTRILSAVEVPIPETEDIIFNQ